MINGPKSFTARQLIEALSHVEPDSIVYLQDHSYDYDMWMDWSFSGVNPDGELIRGEIVRSGDLCEVMDAVAE